MSFGMVLIGSICSAGGFYCGTRKFWWSMLVLAVSFCVLFTMSFGFYFAAEVFRALSQASA